MSVCFVWPAGSMPGLCGRKAALGVKHAVGEAEGIILGVTLHERCEIDSEREIAGSQCGLTQLRGKRPGLIRELLRLGDRNEQSAECNNGKRLP